MNTEVKKMWIDELRSGNIEQSKGKLNVLKEHESDSGQTRLIGMCCLGILCELHRRVTGQGRWVEDDIRPFATYEPNDNRNYEADTMYVPPTVCDWAGLPSHNPIAGSKTLAGANDDGATFEEIADLIEKHL